MSESEATQPPVETTEEPSDVALPGTAEDEVEYKGSGEFGSAEEADVDDFEVDDDDDEWGV